jgi:hypothetical protein
MIEHATIEKEIKTVGDLLEILNQIPKHYAIRMFASYDCDYYAGGKIQTIEIDGETVDFFNEDG